MAHYDDLTPCTYFGRGAHPLAVGWLEVGHPYTTGPLPDAEIMDKLGRLALAARGGFMGWHDCSMCRLGIGERTLTLMGDRGSSMTIQMGIRNIFVPDGDRVFVAPTLVLHYLDSHGYALPGAFVEAVRACPPPDGEAYARAVDGALRLLEG